MMKSPHVSKLTELAEAANVAELNRELAAIPQQICDAREDLNLAKVRELEDRALLIPRILRRRDIMDLEASADVHDKTGKEWDEKARELGALSVAMEQAAIDARHAFDLHIGEVQSSSWRGGNCRTLANEARTRVNVLRALESDK